MVENNYQTNFVVDAGLFQYGRDELMVQRLQELTAAGTDLVPRTYFKGAQLLYALQGECQVTADGAESMTVPLRQGEILFLYPDHFVSVKPSGKRVRLRQLILVGTACGRFLASFGIYHGLKFAADDHAELSRQLRQCLELDDQHGALAAIQDALDTLMAQWQAAGRGPLLQAIRLILRNLLSGNDRLKSVYGELGISRATLHRLFAQGGLKSPGEFLRREKYRLAYQLLTTTNLPINVIAAKVGCSSSVYFNEFVKRCSGKTPGSLRQP